MDATLLCEEETTSSWYNLYAQERMQWLQVFQWVLSSKLANQFGKMVVVVTCDYEVINVHEYVSGDASRVVYEQGEIGCWVGKVKVKQTLSKSIIHALDAYLSP